MAMEGYLKALQAEIDAANAQLVKYKRTLNPEDPRTPRVIAAAQERLAKAYQAYTDAKYEAAGNLPQDSIFAEGGYIVDGKFVDPPKRRTATSTAGATTMPASITAPANSIDAFNASVKPIPESQRMQTQRPVAKTMPAVSMNREPTQADLFTRGFGNMMASMFDGPSPQEQANAANAARLNQMLANVDQMGGYESEQIDDTTRGGKASAMQGLISRGLGATSITAPIAQRYDERGRLMHQALRGRLAGMKNSILGGVNDIPITSSIAFENQRGYDDEMARA